MDLNSMWIESSFTRHECIKFIPSLRDSAKCCCGQLWQYHRDGSPATIRPSQEIQWTTSRHTQKLATNAYGVLEFYGGAHSTKAKYVRMSYETPLYLIDDLFSKEFGLKLPKLLITIHGGNSQFDTKNPKVKKIIRKGLLKAAKTTGAWIFTSGTHTGVSRIVGDAIAADSKQNTSGVVTIGICPWGTVDERTELIGRNKELAYYPKNNSRSRYASLNSQHKYFLLIDNGTAGKHGAETELRRRLEHYICQQHIDRRGDGIDIPIVCLIIEGGPQTIREVFHYVTSIPPVPVIVCDGTGKAADLIATIHRQDCNDSILDDMNEAIHLITNIFQVRYESAKNLYFNLIECMKRRNLITVFSCIDDTTELDECILSALLQDKKLTPSQQMSLALTWDREDVARRVIFAEDHQWPHGSLEQAMMDALTKGRVEFVKLLLEQGVCMTKFLTPKRLEDLYNAPGPRNTLHYIIKDVRKFVAKEDRITLIDIGLAINKLMGGAFRSTYTRKKFMQNYKIKRTNWYHPLTSPSRKGFSEKLNITVFEYPFSELMVWAVLTKRHSIALLMWEHGEEALAKSLIAVKLYKSLAYEAADDDLAQEIYDELRKYALEFDNLALGFLDFCYIQSRELAQHLLTYKLKNWSNQTCLSLAFSVNHKAFLAHPGCQLLLADLWLGGLRSRKHTTFKVIMCLLMPIFIPMMSFLSGEQLRAMPQRLEEHWDVKPDDRSDWDSSDSESEDFNQNAYDLQNPLSSRSCHIVPEYPNSGRESRTSLRESFRASQSKIPEPEFPLMADLDNTGLNLTSKTIPVKIKFYEFYHAPITKFWAHVITFILFVTMYTYFCLVKLNETPQWHEYFLLAYILSTFLEKIREIIATEAVNIRQKVIVWANAWSILDGIFCIAFLIGFHLRLDNGNLRNIGRVILCVDIVYWYIKALDYLSADKYFGPFVTMMWKMVKNMAYFVTLLLIVLMAFGVCRQSILFPNEEFHWRLIRHIFYQPYFMLYGEVFAGDIDPPCGGEWEVPCHTGRWITPIVMSMFLLVANIVLINLLIAVFNNIFNTINTMSQEVWKFQRYKVVMAYEEKPVFPPPFIFLSHVYRFFKFLVSLLCKKRFVRDHGLKIFLNEELLEQLHDSEIECLDTYLTDKKSKELMTIKECNRMIADRTDTISTRTEDVYNKLSEVLTVVQQLANQNTNVSPTSGSCSPESSLQLIVQSPYESALPTPKTATPASMSIANLPELFSESPNTN